VIPQDSFAQLYGAPKSYKSFVALDAACSIATGRPFLGTFEVLRKGDVVYVYGEGGRGIGRRLRAWELHNGCEAERFFGIGQPVDMLGNDPDRIVDAIKVVAASPALIVIDTLARCSGGGDENSTQDMNAFVRGCDRLRLAFPDCTVLVVHHCGWEGSRSRGSRALEAALDTVLQCKKRHRARFPSR
jgi:putative DNA primase/helicase